MLIILTCMMYVDAYTLIIDNSYSRSDSKLHGDAQSQAILHYIHAYFRYLCMLVLFTYAAHKRDELSGISPIEFPAESSHDIYS